MLYCWTKKYFTLLICFSTDLLEFTLLAHYIDTVLYCCLVYFLKSFKLLQNIIVSISNYCIVILLKCYVVAILYCCLIILLKSHGVVILLQFNICVVLHQYFVTETFCQYYIDLILQSFSVMLLNGFIVPLYTHFFLMCHSVSVLYYNSVRVLKCCNVGVLYYFIVFFLKYAVVSVFYMITVYQYWSVVML